MPLLQLDICDLPELPLDAAARFFAEELPEIRDDADAMSDHDLVLVFPPAGHEHRGWRVAAIQELAREFAPRRVNGIAGSLESDQNAICGIMQFLDGAPGVTGQLLPVQASTAGNSGI